MPNTPLRAFLLVAATVAVAVTLAYVTGVFDRFIQAPQTIAALPEATDAKSDRPQPSPDAPASQPAPSAEAPAAPEVVPPSFDVVRVEPDGSLVIAGKAAPGSQVEIVTGSQVIGSAVAGPEGDFAVVLDEPLEPGGYQIVLRATAEGGVVAMSPETAVVSVPDQENGQVLALVEKPGEPSKLITVPEPETPAAETKPGTSVAEASPRAPEGGTPAAEAETSAAAEPRAPAGENAPDAAAGAPEPGAKGQAGDEANMAAAPAQPAAPSGQPAAPADDNAAAGAQAETPAERQVASAPEPEDAAPQAGAEPREPAAPPVSAAQATNEPKVKVEAVEIEGNQVFVAGIADPGALVRVYANDLFLGETRASPGGQFLVEALRELAVGDYIIRADVIADDGSTVIVRATVPFQREPGEAIAAVAAPEPPAAPSGPEQAPAAADEPARAAEPSQPAAPSETPPPTVAEAPPAEAPVSAEGQPDAGASGEPEGVAAQGEATANASSPSATPDASGQAMASADAAATTSGPMAQGEASAPARSDPATPPSSGSSAAGHGPTQHAAAAPSSKPAASTEPPSIAGASLQPVEGSVIIRRGDSLWRISRRVYGRGIRYSTIYLANQDQIADPDLIWPGQVFRVPEKTSEGESADMEAIADRQPPRTAKGDPKTATR